MSGSSIVNLVFLARVAFDRLLLFRLSPKHTHATLAVAGADADDALPPLYVGSRPSTASSSLPLPLRPFSSAWPCHPSLLQLALHFHRCCPLQPNIFLRMICRGVAGTLHGIDVCLCLFLCFLSCLRSTCAPSNNDGGNCVAWSGTALLSGTTWRWLI